MLQSRCLRRFLGCGLAVAISLLTTARSRADFTAVFSAWQGGNYDTVTLFGTRNESDHYGGAFAWTNLDPNNPDLVAYPIPGISGFPSAPADFISFCIEIPQYVYPGALHTNYDLKALEDAPVGPANGSVAMGPTSATLIKELWWQHISHPDPMHPTDNALTNSTTIGAMQIAIWKLVYDGGSNLDLATGNLTAANAGTAGSDSNLAQQWLNQIANNAQSNPGFASLMAFSSPAADNPGGYQYQDQVVELPADMNHIPGVPEAESLAIWSLLGAIGTVVCRYRRRHEGPSSC
jgi:hypothetical protein